MKDIQLSFILCVLTILLIVSGCREVPVEDQPFVKHVAPKIEKPKPVIERLVIPVQSDGEIKPENDVRDTMDAEIKEFIHTHIFWAGKFSLLIAYDYSIKHTMWKKDSDKPMIDQYESKLEYIWLNPVGIQKELRYGADFIFISTDNKNFFSPSDVNFLNDGYSRIYLPETILVDQFSKYQQFVKPYTSTNVDNLKFVTTPSQVSGVSGLENWRKGVGYLFELQSAKDKYKSYKIWYTGPIDNNILPEGVKSRKDLRELQIKTFKYPGSTSDDASYMHDVDVIVVPIADPSKISPRKLDILAGYLNAKVIYFIGADLMDEEQKNKFIESMSKNARTPLWLPEIATSLKSETKE